MVREREDNLTSSLEESLVFIYNHIYYAFFASHS